MNMYPDIFRNTTTTHLRGTELHVALKSLSLVLIFQTSLNQTLSPHQQAECAD